MRSQEVLGESHRLFTPDFVGSIGGETVNLMPDSFASMFSWNVIEEEII